ncbi:MAG: hypothetical protein IJV05_07025 [Muribaculaceae bacterium]|nr:hypothetical protein [Muribaculaceae bacterium]
MGQKNRPFVPNSLVPPSVVASGQLVVMLSARCCVPRAGVLDLHRDCHYVGNNRCPVRRQ